jgi:hypothetical protein
LASCHLTIASEIETVPARAAPAYLAGKRPSCASPNEFAKPAKTMTVSEQIQHRKLSPPANYRASWPYRSHNRADAAPLVPGCAEQIVIPLLPVAWRFERGSRIRLALSGADIDHYGQVPHGRPPMLTELKWLLPCAQSKMMPWRCASATSLRISCFSWPMMPCARP